MKASVPGDRGDESQIQADQKSPLHIRLSLYVHLKQVEEAAERKFDLSPAKQVLRA